MLFKPKLKKRVEIIPTRNNNVATSLKLFAFLTIPIAAKIVASIKTASKIKENVIS